MKKEDSIKVIMLYSLWIEAMSWMVIPAETNIVKDAEKFSEWLETHWDDWSELEQKVMDTIDSYEPYKSMPKEDRYIWKKYKI